MKTITDLIKAYLAAWFPSKSMLAEILAALNDNKADKEGIQQMYSEFQKLVEASAGKDLTIEGLISLIESNKGKINIENFSGNESLVNPKHFYSGEKDKTIPMEIHPDIMKRIEDMEKALSQLNS